MPTQRPNPCRYVNVHFKREKNQKRSVGLLTSGNLVSHPSPPRRRHHAEQDAGESYRQTRAFERFLTSWVVEQDVFYNAEAV